MTVKILFVDDEANVLSGLRRMLRSQRKVWEMEFANGGEAALALFAEKRIDVIVSDMRMPGMDGAELLRRVAEQYPDTVRLVLSGQSEHERIFRAIGPAHQFLSKPCESDTLIATINRACALQNQLNHEGLRKVTSRISKLPSLPSVYRDLVVELESEESSMERVAEIIGRDLAMSAKVLQLVNSSFFGLPQRVTSPAHAVSLLGLSVIRPLTLSVGALAKFDIDDDLGFDIGAASEHALSVATTAKRIAEIESTDSQCADDAFVAGMMHDIGKLVLAAHFRDEYEECRKVTEGDEIPFHKAESAVFGTTHAEVGAYLLGLWGLPNPIVEAVALHHRPGCSNAEQFEPLTAVHVADSLQHNVSSLRMTSDCHGLDNDYLAGLGLSDHLAKWSDANKREASNK